RSRRNLDGEAGHATAVAVPRVQAPLEAGGDDLRLSIAEDVPDSNAANDLPAGDAAVDCLRMRHEVRQVVDGDRPPRRRRAVGTKGHDSAVGGRFDDVEFATALDV